MTVLGTDMQDTESGNHQCVKAASVGAEEDYSEGFFGDYMKDSCFLPRLAEGGSRDRFRRQGRHWSHRRAPSTRTSMSTADPGGLGTNELLFQTFGTDTVESERPERIVTAVMGAACVQLGMMPIFSGRGHTGRSKTGAVLKSIAWKTVTTGNKEAEPSEH